MHHYYKHKFKKKSNPRISTLEHWNSFQALKWFPLEKATSKKTFLFLISVNTYVTDFARNTRRTFTVTQQGLFDTQNDPAVSAPQPPTPRPWPGWLSNPQSSESWKQWQRWQITAPQSPSANPIQGEKGSPVIETFKCIWAERTRAQENSLRKCKQLTVTASQAFLSKAVTCSEPGTVRSCRGSSPADWWKWLALGCQVKNQSFISPRQLPPTQPAAAGHGKGRLLCFVVNMRNPSLWPQSSTTAKSIGRFKLRNRLVGHRLRPKLLEI